MTLPDRLAFFCSLGFFEGWGPGPAAVLARLRSASGPDQSRPLGPEAEADSVAGDLALLAHDRARVWVSPRGADWPLAYDEEALTLVSLAALTRGRVDAVPLGVQMQGCRLVHATRINGAECHREVFDAREDRDVAPTRTLHLVDTINEALFGVRSALCLHEVSTGGCACARAVVVALTPEERARVEAMRGWALSEPPDFASAETETTWFEPGDEWDEDADEEMPF